MHSVTDKPAQLSHDFKTCDPRMSNWGRLQSYCLCELGRPESACIRGRRTISRWYRLEKMGNMENYAGQVTITRGVSSMLSVCKQNTADRLDVTLLSPLDVGTPMSAIICKWCTHTCSFKTP
eukprot:scpid110053/ scgid34639/ 